MGKNSRVLLAAGFSIYLFSISGHCETFSADDNASSFTEGFWPELAVVAFDSLRVERGSDIEGNVAVLYPGRHTIFGDAQEIKIAPSVRINGSITAEDISLSEGVKVTGLVSATNVIGPAAKSVKLGEAPVLPLPLSVPALPWFFWGLKRIDASKSPRTRLSPGSYGHVQVGFENPKESILQLETGIYNFYNLNIGPRSGVECLGRCEIRIASSFVVGSGGFFLGNKDIDIFVVGMDSEPIRQLSIETAVVQLNKASRIEARIYAPNGTIWADTSTEVKGKLIGRAVFLGAGTHVSGQKPDSQMRMLDITSVDRSISTFRVDPSSHLLLKDLFRLYARSFELTQDNSMVEAGEFRTADGVIHTHFLQLYRGVPVFGAEMVIQHENGEVTSGIGRIIQYLNMQTVPKLTESQAIKLALKRLGAKLVQEKSIHSVLGIGSVDSSMRPGSFRLMYRLRIDTLDPFGSYTVDVDANTGATVGFASNVVNYSVMSSGDTLHYGSKTFVADAFNDSGQVKYRLVAPEYISSSTGLGMTSVGITTLRSLGISIPNATPPPKGFIWNNIVVDYFVNENNDFKFWPLPNKPDPTTTLDPFIYGVSVHWGLQKAVDYWKKVNWLGTDGVGAKQVLAIIDCPEAVASGTSDYWIVEDRFCFPANDGYGSLQIVGHEFAHAVFNHVTSPFWSGEEPLVNPTKGETGVLTEGFAYVFGYLLQNDPDNWCASYLEPYKVFYEDDLGDGSCNGGTALCPGETCNVNHTCSVTVVPVKECLLSDMSNPKKTNDPDTYEGSYWADPQCGGSKDNCHSLGTLFGHWFYILVKGKAGTNDKGDSYNVPAIGRDKAEKVAIRTLTTKMWSSADFMGVRLASIQAAEDIFGKYAAETVAVVNAWYAVGIGDPFYSQPSETGLEPWPARLKWEEHKNEIDWEVQVSTSSNFDKDLITLGPQQSEFAFGKILLVAMANLKPATTYFWRVRARLEEPELVPPPSSPRNLGPVRAWRGSANNQSGSVMISPWTIPLLTGDWTDWEIKQSFTTAAKIPQPLTPAPLPLSPNYSGGILDASITVYPWNAEFSWKSVKGASQYTLWVSENPDQQCPQKKLQLPSPKWKVYIVPAPKIPSNKVSYEIPLFSNRTYYWWLMVHGPGGISGSCAFDGNPIRFQTTIPKSILLSPVDAQQVSPFEVNLTWEPVKGAASYRLQITQSTKFPKGGFEETSSTNKVFQPMKSGTFYWRVQPKGPLSGDIGGMSPTWKFISDFALTKPKLLYPIDEQKVEFNHKLKFGWLPVAAASSYRLTVYQKDNGISVSADSGFYACSIQNQPAVCIDLNGVSTFPAGYCWTLRAVGPGGVEGLDSDQGCYVPSAAYVQILSPESGDDNVEWNPTKVILSCPYAPGGFRLELKVYENGACPGVPMEKNLSPGTFETSLILAPNTSYCLGVWTLNGDGSNGRFSVSVFQTQPELNCGSVKLNNIIVQSPATYNDLGIGQVPATWNQTLTLINFNPKIDEISVTVGYTTYQTQTLHPLNTSNMVPFKSLPKDTTYSGPGDARRYTIVPISPGSDSTCFAADNYGTCRLFYIQVHGKSGNCSAGEAGFVGSLFFQW